MGKTVLAINLGNFGSTGAIVRNIGSFFEAEGGDYYFAYPESSLNKKKKHNDIIICSAFFRKIAEKLSYFTGYRGCWLPLHTFVLIQKIKKIKPDIIHLHNLHDTYINLPILFSFLKKENIKVIWTLHDCWAFTAQCPYFSMVKCTKWKTHCYDCPQYMRYPSSRIDTAQSMYEFKKRWFIGVKDMTIVTPSQWLAGLVKESYLKDYPVRIINNGIDLNMFKPTLSSFREKYNIEKGKNIVLGVAFDWGIRKGLDVFIDLAKRLNKQYQIVLVGTNDDIDQQLPDNIISIHRTQNQKELAEIYTAADLFVNPTREENYPTVNMESISCGTPVLTFQTGGSPEMLDETCGSVVNCDDIDSMEKEIIRICENRVFSSEQCIHRASHFSSDISSLQYISLYNENFGI